MLQFGYNNLFFSDGGKGIKERNYFKIYSEAPNLLDNATRWQLPESVSTVKVKQINNLCRVLFEEKKLIFICDEDISCKY